MTLRHVRAVAALFPALVLLSAAAAHPLHTTVTEVTYEPASRSARIMMRVFIDDFSLAVSRHAGVAVAADSTVPDAAALAYVAATFSVIDRSGRRLRFASCGSRRTAEVLWLCLRAPAPGGLAGARIRNGVLFDLYADQVNIVQVDDGRRRESMLFTKDDGPKQLR